MSLPLTRSLFQPQERREYPREETNGQFSFKITKVRSGTFHGNPQGDAEILDVSKGGLKFNTELAVSRGMQILVTEDERGSIGKGRYIRIIRVDLDGKNRVCAAEYDNK
ncbi:MAG: hypothetical protein NUW37_08310 [Planctomycetes bacterium]|nr:hypothetical protein [Planctomycetota bacterium]